jgi:hypothetical protein
MNIDLLRINYVHLLPFGSVVRTLRGRATYLRFCWGFFDSFRFYFSLNSTVFGSLSSSENTSNKSETIPPSAI